MKFFLLKIHSYLLFIGVDLIKFIRFFRGIPFFWKDYYRLKKQLSSSGDFPFGKIYPILDERTSEGGTLRGHYFHMDLLVAQKVYQNSPFRHIDIGSRTDGFVAHVASFREIEIFDIRHTESSVGNIKFRQANLMELPSELIDSCDSVSSLHAIEHFGLGRYGDPINSDGHLHAIDNIKNILKTGGKFYFATPIGKHQRIEFNAHRVFSLAYLIPILQSSFTIESFSYVDDAGELIVNADLTIETINNSFNCTYGCGIFVLKKN
jgi:hypothetical protein